MPDNTRWRSDHARTERPTLDPSLLMCEACSSVHSRCGPHPREVARPWCKRCGGRAIRGLEVTAGSCSKNGMFHKMTRDRFCLERGGSSNTSLNWLLST